MRYRSTLVQVGWRLISEVLVLSHENNFIYSAQTIIMSNEFENNTFNTTATLLQASGPFY